MFTIFGKRYYFTGGGLCGLIIRTFRPTVCIMTICIILAAFTECESIMHEVKSHNIMVETPAHEEVWLALGEFELTAYCGCSTCCGMWSDEQATTASGTRAVEGRTVAVDTDIIPFGSIVEINGHEYIAEDTGSAIQGERIDIYFDDHQDALQFGRQHAQVKIKQSA